MQDGAAPLEEVVLRAVGGDHGLEELRDLEGLDVGDILGDVGDDRLHALGDDGVLDERPPEAETGVRCELGHGEDHQVVVGVGHIRRQLLIRPVIHAVRNLEAVVKGRGDQLVIGIVRCRVDLDHGPHVTGQGISFGPRGIQRVGRSGNRSKAGPTRLLSVDGLGPIVAQRVDRSGEDLMRAHAGDDVVAVGLGILRDPVQVDDGLLQRVLHWVPRGVER
mmetsp:Transcript_8895/g.28518  ORF Transcript_8895/g.28518 Transcript_8895/m.28518 type:complete len:220 (-) Transcript_8895:335-994(-)